jgi:hypothetical protein
VSARDAVDDAGPVEARRDREAARDSGGLEQPDLLHPADVELQVRAPRGQWVKAALSTPRQEGAQVGFGVLA